MNLAHIETRIYEIRGLKVMLDFDLADLYETETKYLKRTVRANLNRFPSDFMFELSTKEWETLRCNICTSNNRGGTRYLPFAFTEQGVAMLSGLLNSDKAILVNIAIMRAFVFLRQYALTHKDLTEKLKELESKYDKRFKDVYEAITFLLQKDRQETEQKQRKRIGYKNILQIKTNLTGRFFSARPCVILYVVTPVETYCRASLQDIVLSLPNP